MLKYIFALSLLATPCLAQQSPTPNEQALAAKLLQEMQEGLSCNTNLIRVQAELTKARTRIQELETKPAPEK